MDKGEEILSLLNLFSLLPYSSIKAMIVDSGFYVLRRLMELKKLGVFAFSLIK